jgi:hypothetical protein
MCVVELVDAAAVAAATLSLFPYSRLIFARSLCMEVLKVGERQTYRMGFRCKRKHHECVGESWAAYTSLQFADARTCAVKSDQDGLVGAADGSSFPP